jgi:hypothetical protein
MISMMRVEIEPYARDSLIDGLEALGIREVSIKQADLYLSHSEYEYVPRIEAEFLVNDLQVTDIAKSLRQKFERNTLRMQAFPVRIL